MNISFTGHQLYFQLQKSRVTEEYWSLLNLFSLPIITDIKLANMKLEVPKPQYI